MSRPDSNENQELRAKLPPELRSLDEELAGLRIEERPSFGPELEAELLRAWQDSGRDSLGRGGVGGWRRWLVAAVAAGILLSGVAVPSARASVIRLVRTVLKEAVPALFSEEENVLPAVEVRTPPPSEPSAAAGPEPQMSSITGRESGVGEASLLPEVEITFPEILSRREAEQLIRRYYPVVLQRAGVGGSVKLMFWVDSAGIPENIQMREGSGYRSLNYAAMRAARELRFRPATRNGVPVGTWVEFDIHFVPGVGGGVMDLDPVGSGGMGGY